MGSTIYKTMASLAKRYRLPLVIFLILGISQTFVGNYAIVMFQRLLDGLPGATQFNDVLWLLIGYLGLTATNHLLIYVEGVPRSTLNNGAFLWSKFRALEKISRIDYLAYQDLGTGNLIQMVENGATAIQNIFMGFYLTIIRSLLPSLIISLYFINFYDQKLFLIIVAGYGILFVIAHFLMGFWRKEVDKLLENQEDHSRFSVRAFMELIVFRINGRFKAEFERVRNISDEIVRSRAKIYLLQELFYTGFAFLVVIIQAGVVIRQINLILNNASTVGTLVALVTFVGGVWHPITGFSMAYVRYKMEMMAYARFKDFLSLPDDAGFTRKESIQMNAGFIELENVSFIYPTGEKKEFDQALFEDFTLTFKGGETTALVGESGGGKSTLVKLILHLLKPTQGKIMVDGQNLENVFLPSYYETISYIPQEPPIFDGTLRENLVFDLQPKPEKIREVIHQVGLEEWVKKLPDGLDTMVGERGMKLSGGERQRLAFGRVMLQDPKIVIMDEPTSSLDSLTEEFVTENLREFLKEKTVIIVAHRLQTVKSADKIVVLEDGKILQQGNFDTLVSNPGKFMDLWNTQANSEM